MRKLFFNDMESVDQIIDISLSFLENGVSRKARVSCYDSQKDGDDFSVVVGKEPLDDSDYWVDSVFEIELLIAEMLSTREDNALVTFELQMLVDGKREIVEITVRDSLFHGDVV